MIRSCVKAVKGYSGGAGGALTEREFFEELMAANEL